MKNKIDKERIDKLLKLYNKKIRAFKKKHVTYIYCFPNGKKLKKVNGIYVYACQSFRRDIYYCKNLCPKQCLDFERKIYLCLDLECGSREDCMSFSEKKRFKRCKKYNLSKERKELDKIYEKFFLLAKVYRGLKINPKKTLRWLDQRKKENGKVPSKKHRKKVKRKGQRRQEKA